MAQAFYFLSFLDSIYKFGLQFRNSVYFLYFLQLLFKLQFDRSVGAHFPGGTFNRVRLILVNLVNLIVYFSFNVVINYVKFVVDKFLLRIEIEIFELKELLFLFFSRDNCLEKNYFYNIKVSVTIINYFRENGCQAFGLRTIEKIVKGNNSKSIFCIKCTLWYPALPGVFPIKVNLLNVDVVNQAKNIPKVN